MALAVPQIIKDSENGEFISKFRCSPEFVGERMREGGATEDQIADHTIHFSAEDTFDEATGGLMFGRYIHEDRTATIYLRSQHKIFMGVLEHIRSISPNGRVSPATMNIHHADTNDKVNETLFHETKHAIDYHVMGVDEYRAEREGHETVQSRSRSRLSSALTLGAIASAGGAMYEFIQAADSKESMYAAVGLGALSLTSSFGSSTLNRRYNSYKGQHRVYTQRPSEIRAIEYAKEQIALADKASKYPVKIKFRPTAVGY